MRFRVLSGNIPRGNPQEDLRVIYDAPDARVEASSEALVIQSPGGDATILAVGTLVGRRTPEGRLQAVESVSGFISTLVDERPPTSWKEAYEGDMVLIVVRSNGEVIVSGDRFFKRDVYVQEFSGGVALAADLDLLPENPALHGYDDAALAHTLTYYGHRPPKRHTIYRSVRRLAPGDVALIREGSIKVESTAFRPVPVREFSEQEHERYYDAFLEYLSAAGSSDGNSLFLSSGWDSSSILAGLVEVFGASKVTGFLGHNVYSVRSGTNNQFEMDRAQAIAKHYGIRLHVVELDYVNAGPDWFERAQETFRAHNIQSMTGINHLRLAHAASEIAPGAPIFTGETMVDNALNCAIKIQKEVQKLNRDLGKNIGIGIGINSGHMVMGAMGSKERMDFTVIGDNVNLGARLCSAAKAGEIILSEKAKNYIISDQFNLIETEPISVKGKEQPINIFKVF